MMKKHLTTAQLVSSIVTLCGMVAAQASIAAPEQKFVVKTFGGYPISHNITSLWLSGSNRRPLVMVYFYGPRDWYLTLWNIDSKFEEDKPGWAELQSQNVTLRIEVYPETWEVAVQSSKFRVKQSNTFLILYTGELLVPQKVIPLGVFDLPPSTDKPASLLLLQGHQELVERINKEARAGIRRYEFGKSADHSLTRPCTPKNIGFLYKNPSSSLGTTLLFSSVMPHSLTSTYTLPCWQNPVSSNDVQ